MRADHSLGFERGGRLDRVTFDEGDRVEAGAVPPADEPSGEGAGDEVLEAIGFEPTSFEQVVVRTGLPLGEVRARLDAQVVSGRAVEQSGWFERVGRGDGV